MPKPTKVSSLQLMTSQAKLGVSYIQLALYIQLNNGLINCTHVGRFSPSTLFLSTYFTLLDVMGDLWS